jgi:hypothetical protein
MRQRTWIASLVFAIAGCLVQRGRAEPLYPISGERLPPERVAQLDGYVRKVDDKQIDQSGSYELLPGCHIIETPARWGNVSSSGGVIVDTGNRVFTLLMKPGHHYHVDVSVKMMGGSGGSAAVEAFEQDPKGNRTVVYGPGINTATAEACSAAESSAP